MPKRRRPDLDYETKKLPDFDDLRDPIGLALARRLRHVPLLPLGDGARDTFEMGLDQEADSSFEPGE